MVQFGKIGKNFLKISKKGKLPRGESESLEKEKLVAIRWKEKWDVFVVSTIHGYQIEKAFRHGKEEPITKAAIFQYNSYKNRVDNATSTCQSTIFKE